MSVINSRCESMHQQRSLRSIIVRDDACTRLLGHCARTARTSDVAMLGMVIAANANAQAIASVVLRSMPRIDRQATRMMRKQHAMLAMLAWKRPGSQTSDSDSRTASPDPGIRDRRSWVLGSPSPGPG